MVRTIESTKAFKPNEKRLEAQERLESILAVSALRGNMEFSHRITVTRRTSGCRQPKSASG
jgi:hypothetical protein